VGDAKAANPFTAKSIALIALVLSLIFSSCASSPIKFPNIISLAEEIEIGRRASQQIEKEARILKMQAMEEYIQRLGQRLARNSDLPQISYRFKVIDNDQVNAFALPGGYIYIYTGLIEACQTESQLVSVIAHEIGHAAARHWSQMASAQQGINLVASIVFTVLGAPAAWQRDIMGLAVGLGFLAYSRSQESEADRLGLRYMTRTGYNPEGMVGMFEVLMSAHQKEPSRLSSLFLSHPLTSSRIENTREALQHIPPYPGPDQPVTNTPEFSIIKSYFLRD
jgi:predicted Zn-dependent protease|tara:strand:- start:230 stop:1069 length:840 start_codon:yes stop_codon:yes gene_type:complete